MKFDNKVALITGGTSGIGFAAAKQLAEGGAKVAIIGRDQNKGEHALSELRKIHSDVMYLSVDVTQSTEVKKMVADTIARFGKLDIAFNNAANDEVRSLPTHEFLEEDFDKLILVTLKGVWLCMKHEIEAMLRGTGGTIVNTSSVDALLCSAGTAVYAAGKSGVIALTKSIAQEYGSRGIRINSLCPGAIRTPLLERKFLHLTPDEVHAVEEKYNSFNALKRIGRPEEAASVATWLLSEESSYVTGQNIVVDGGIQVVG
ncbi:SDR family NAD(P)-dependent oxidoreductase [Ammoniphilus sp. CFH 90114]|uniref:SDR family NAD(P)-dependent oxidoreductase n=1 Tax=Ammoniphilus sp. CFH 90114 TaxID=2493665 RepID=UPI00100EDC6B|nr:glucose 1-dehydrogenase [Ammoniphilus sp. CFH 90114]RXT03887.1 glucose 1-dehydrogenase [Ammoniphilus sp. CFH 90114]